MTSKRLKLGLLGLVYGAVLATLGFVASGGGHSNLILMLAIAPYGVGFLLWPIFGIIISDLRSAWSRRVFLLLMAIHYGSVIIYLSQNREGESYWLDIGLTYEYVVVCMLLAGLLYLLGQILLWTAFLKRDNPSTL